MTQTLDADELDAFGPETETTVDTEAPFGRTLSGAPKKRPGGRPAGKKAARPRLTRPASKPTGAAPAAPRPTTTRRKPSPSRGTDYRPGLKGLVAIPAMILNWVSPLDGAAVLMHSDGVVEAINETAQDRAEVAAICQKILRVGPYGAIIASLIPMAAQVAENHSWAPTETLVGFGAIPKAHLVESLGLKFAAQQSAEQAAQEAAPAPKPAEAPAQPPERATEWVE